MSHFHNYLDELTEMDVEMDKMNAGQSPALQESACGQRSYHFNGTRRHYRFSNSGGLGAVNPFFYTSSIISVMSRSCCRSLPLAMDPRSTGTTISRSTP